jgi:twinkle protein
MINEDGSTYCFTPDCPKPYVREGGLEIDALEKEFEAINGSDSNKPKKSNFTSVYEVREEYPYAKDVERQIPVEVMEHYGCKVAYDSTGKINEKYYAYNFDSNNQPQGYKVRVLPKDFNSKGCIGKVSGLYGIHLYSGGKRIIITEGEEDTHAVQAAWYRKYKKFYPVVSLRGAGITKDLIEERTKLRKFDEVVLWLDSDKHGEKAVKDAAKIIGYDKVKIVKASEKDASDLWRKNKDEVLIAVYNATEYTPAGILNKDDLWKQLEAYNEIESVPYPSFMEGLNSKLRGMRFGEITLWTSGTGSGKSTLLREIAVHLLETTKERLGIVSLEESPAETARKMAGMAINKNPAKEEIPIDELKVGFDAVFGDDRVMVLDHQGSISDGSVMDFLEYMCLSGCKYIFIDHITILASEGTEGLSGNEAIDKIMNDMLRLVKKYNVWIGLISHLRKTDNKSRSFEEGKLPGMDDIRGSGSIKQISMDIIAFARNVSADNEEKRNTIYTKVLKCRYTGLTGPSGSFRYDFDTGRLSPGEKFESIEDEEEIFEKEI